MEDTFRASGKFAFDLDKHLVLILISVEDTFRVVYVLVKDIDDALVLILISVEDTFRDLLKLFLIFSILSLNPYFSGRYVPRFWVPGAFSRYWKES